MPLKTFDNNPNNEYIFDEEGNSQSRDVAEKYIYNKNRDKYPKPFGVYVVHHIDGDTFNNSIKNLYICTKEEHNFIHKEQKARLKRFVNASEVDYFLKSRVPEGQKTLRELELDRKIIRKETKKEKQKRREEEARKERQRERSEKELIEKQRREEENKLIREHKIAVEEAKQREIIQEKQRRIKNIIIVLCILGFIILLFIFKSLAFGKYELPLTIVENKNYPKEINTWEEVNEICGLRCQENPVEKTGANFELHFLTCYCNSKEYIIDTKTLEDLTYEEVQRRVENQ